jgi:zinc transport system ATP-binding protein
MTSEEIILSVSNLTVTFQNQEVLSNINFSIKKGITLAIIGPNGAGKSVLLRALLNLVTYSGKIEWGEKVKIGYVPQIVSFRDIPISVLEFLTIKKGVEPAKALRAVGLDERILMKSLGVLSGGQLRRVLIAWAIKDRPNVLLFDEPTTGVDIDSEEAIYEMLRQLTHIDNKTLILISHNRHIVRDYSDYVLALDRCVQFFGESNEVMNPELIDKLYREEHACPVEVSAGDPLG